MYTRKILEQIKPFLKTDDVLLFYGARQVGKTTIMKLIQQDLKEKSIFFDLERREHLDIVNTYDQEDFIRNIKLHYSWKEDEKIVIFIDEVQYLDNPTSFLKYLHDHYENIKFIVSGSSTLDIR
ncbi:MAG: AAA family ATPase [Candidatus Peribacteria bacterium]|jgi:predicted AAA+ superfamily ATPase|nr:AAA family ATPase [Candidatus Peribacteria bacterium]